MSIDIPGTFIQANMDEIVHMKLEVGIAKTVEKVDSKLYRKCIEIEKGMPLLHVELRKVFYRLNAALLFWQKLTAKLK